MGTKVKIGSHDNLYQFWGEKIKHKMTKLLENSVQEKCLINLASQEYAKVLDLPNFTVPVITPQFKRFHKKTVTYQVVGVLAKYARGLMVRYMAQHQLTKSEDIKKFNLEGYQYRPELSSNQEWIFIQN